VLLDGEEQFDDPVAGKEAGKAGSFGGQNV
jgi:hypothetical protein